MMDGPEERSPAMQHDRTIIDVPSHHKPMLGPTERAAIARSLGDLAERVERGELGCAEEPWRGADVAVVSEPSPFDPDAFYAPDLEVVTAHVGEVSWAFCELRDAFSAFLTSDSKYWFFDNLRLAATLAVAVQHPLVEEEARTTVRFMVEAARAMLASIDAA
jgi:hypothetical protein